VPVSKAWTYSLPISLVLMVPFDLLASLAMDIYLPVVPQMPGTLATTPATVQLTLSLYMVVLGCGQLVFGPLSDRFGRRPVLLRGALLFTASSVGLACTSVAPVFVALRVTQAVGAAAALVATFATVRDVYAARPEGAVIYSLFGSMLAFVPALGPVLGALVDHGLGWRAIFFLLALLGSLAGLQALVRWPETRTAGQAVRPAHVGRILASAPFWVHTVGFSAAMGAFFVYFSTAPGILIDRLGLSAIAFSLVFATPALVMIVTSRFVTRLVQRWGERGCLIRGMGLLVAGAALLVPGEILGLSLTVAFVAPMGLIAVGIVVTCAVTANGALRAFGDVAGTATAIYYCAESVIVGAAGTLVVLGLPSATAWPLAAFCAAGALLTMGLAHVWLRP